MSNPDRQHYIPRSYLNKFAREKESKYFVCIKSTDSEEIIEVSTKDVCLKKHLYTIPNVEKDKKYLIENFYADCLDSVYPEVYDILTNENITEVNETTREKIIATTLNLYFRTIKFITAHNHLTSQVLGHINSMVDGKGKPITVDYLGRKIKFTPDNFDEIKKELEKENHMAFLQQHLEMAYDFIKYKLNDGICVWKIIDDSEIITSDNPVIIRNTQGKLRNIYDPDNIVLVPIDNKHVLSIAPKIDKIVTNQIFRNQCDIITTLTTNIEVERNAEKWIIGSERSLTNHINDQKKYNELTPENLKIVENVKKKAVILSKTFQKIQKENGFVTGTAYIDIKKLQENPLFEDEPNLERLINKLRTTKGK